MTLNKTHLIVFVVGVVIGALCGFFTAKGIYDRPIEESVTRDTVTLHDTIPEYLPAPKDSAHVKWVTRWLPAMWPRQSRDTGNLENHIADAGIMVHDTVAVEVPITSKHYGNENYDAWVSGFEPSLDSIKVYQKTEYITETVTRSKPPNRFTVGIQGGYGYGFKSKTWEPYVGVGIGIRIF